MPERQSCPERNGGRGLDVLVGAYNYLDLAPKGRDGDVLPFTMAWVRHHDRYEVRRIGER